MLPLTKDELKSLQYEKVCYICGERNLRKLSKSINFWKVRDHCCDIGKYRGIALGICNLKFNVPNEIPVVFHNDSNYRVSEMGSTGGGGQSGQNGQKLHGNHQISIFASKQWGDMGDKFLGSGGGSNPSPPTRGNSEL